MSEISGMALATMKVLASADGPVSTAYVSGVLPKRHSSHAGRTDRAAKYLRSLRDAGLVDGLERKGHMRVTLWEISPAGRSLIAKLKAEGSW